MTPAAARAANADCVIQLRVRMGDSSPPAVRCCESRAPIPRGWRTLVDIAIRSAGDDPTTSVEAPHRIHDYMRQLARRPFPSGCHCDERGNLRLVVPIRD